MVLKTNEQNDGYSLNFDVFSTCWLKQASSTADEYSSLVLLTCEKVNLGDKVSIFVYMIK